MRTTHKHSHARLRLFSLPACAHVCARLPRTCRAVGIKLTLDDFQRISDRVPLIADLKPSGKYVMEDVHKVRRRQGPRCLGAPGVGCT